MSSFILSTSLLLVLLLMVIALFSRISISISEATSSFSFTSSNKNASFESNEIALYGDAKLVDNGSSVQLTDSVSHGGGRVVYKKPIESAETKSEFFTGFSTFLSFSLSPGHGGRLGFVAFPANGTFDHSLFEVKFDFSENFTNFTNYQAGSKFLDVWLSKSERFKSVDSLFIPRIDLLKDDEFMVGVKSYSGNFDLHSWRLEARY